MHPLFHFLSVSLYGTNQTVFIYQDKHSIQLILLIAVHFVLFICYVGDVAGYTVLLAGFTFAEETAISGDALSHWALLNIRPVGWSMAKMHHFFFWWCSRLRAIPGYGRRHSKSWTFDLLWRCMSITHPGYFLSAVLLEHGFTGSAPRFIMVLFAPAALFGSFYHHYPTGALPFSGVGDESILVRDLPLKHLLS